MTAREMLDVIAARAEAATEGPWKYIGRNWIDTPPITVDEADWGPEGHHGLKVHTAQETRAYRYADAAFIAAARQDVPTLVAALRAALDREALAELLSRARHPVRWEYTATSAPQHEDYVQADAVIALVESALDPS